MIENMQFFTFDELARKMQRLDPKSDLGRVAAFFTPEMMAQVTVQASVGMLTWFALDHVQKKLFGSESNVEKMQKDSSKIPFILADAAARTSAAPFVFDPIRSTLSPYYGDNAFNSFVGGGPTLQLIQDTADVIKPAFGGRGISIDKYLYKLLPNAWYRQMYENDVVGQLEDAVR